MQEFHHTFLIGFSPWFGHTRSCTCVQWRRLKEKEKIVKKNVKRRKERKQEKSIGGSCADMGKFKSGRSHTDTHMEKRRADLHTQKGEKNRTFAPNFPTLAHVPHHHHHHHGWHEESKTKVHRQLVTLFALSDYYTCMYRFRGLLYAPSQQRLADSNVLEQERRNNIPLSLVSGQWPNPLLRTADDAIATPLSQERNNLRPNKGKLFNDEQSCIWQDPSLVFLF